MYNVHLIMLNMFDCAFKQSWLMYINFTLPVNTSIHQSCVCKINIGCVCLFLFVFKETWGIVILLASLSSS